jgi:hypothetical protein
VCDARDTASVRDVLVDLCGHVLRRLDRRRGDQDRLPSIA